MNWLLVPVIVNPNWSLRTPALLLTTDAGGFHTSVGRPPNVEPQPVLPAK